MKRLILVLFVATGVFAQSANVIQLEPSDSARAQKAWDALQKAQAEWDALYDEFQDKYIVVLKSNDHSTVQRSSGKAVSVPSDWARGFEFSKDFKAVVPKTMVTTGTTITGSWTYPNCWSVPSTTPFTPLTTPTGPPVNPTFRYVDDSAHGGLL
jgi:hypothetical protein